MPIAHNPETNETVYLDKNGQWVPARVATNPQTGERLAFDGDGWEPIQAGDQATSLRQDDSSFVDDFNKFTMNVVNGATFGLRDKAAGLGNMLKEYAFQKAGEYFPEYFGDYKPDYRKAYHEPQKERLDWNERNPGKAIAGNILGGVVNPATIPAARWAAAAKTARGIAGKAALTSAAFGAAQGAGETQTPFYEGEGLLQNFGRSAINSMGGAALGGAFGGSVGLVLPPVLNQFGKLGNYLWGKAAYPQGTQALRQLAKALRDDHLTPAKATEKIRRLGPHGMMADAGENTQMLAKSVYDRPGPGSRILEKSVRGRQEGVRGKDQILRNTQGQRVESLIDDLDIKKFQSAKEEIAAARKAYGTQYEAAKSGADVVDIEPLLANLNNEIIKSKGSIKFGLQRVKKLLVDAKGAPETSVESLHQAKMAIDDLMSGNVASSIGRVAKGRIRDYQNQLVSAIEDAGESGAAYRAGRLGTAGQWRLDEALGNGNNFMSKAAFKNAGEMKKYIKGLSQEELDHFRIGAIQGLREKLEGTVVRGDATKKLIGVHGLEEKIRMAFGDDEVFKKYISGMEGEKAMYNTYEKLFTGSQTSKNMMANEAATIDPSPAVQTAVGMKTSNPREVWSGVKGLIGLGGNKYSIPPGQSAELGRMLTAQDVPGLALDFRNMKGNEILKYKLLKALIGGEGSISGTTEGRGFGMGLLTGRN